MEDLKQKYNPDGSILRQAQLRMLDMLIVVDDIFRRNKIEYWLHAGTLIGAVRHQGFIPWDDDVDIAVRTSDMPRIRKVLKAELPDNLCLQDATTDSNFYLPFSKVRDKNSLIDGPDSKYLKERGLCIDIFPIEEIISTKFKSPIDKLFRHCIWGRSQFTDRTLDRLIGLFGYYPTIFFIGVLRLWIKLFPTHNWGNTYGWSDPLDERESDIFPVKDINFEGHTFLGPANADGYLKVEYGDYMQIPPEDKRSVNKHAVKIEIYD